jgi:hypothetical protein
MVRTIEVPAHMTQPDDDTQPQPVVPPPASTTPEPPATPPAPAPATPEPAPVTPAAPQPNVLSGATQPAATMRAAPPPATPTDWREPPWIPPRDRRRAGPSLGALIVGGGILLVGLWFFLERTLGLDLPQIHWGSLWPIVLIVLGGAILLRAVVRR